MRLLNIGANKGYAINHFLMRFLPGWSTNSTQWFDEIVSSRRVGAPCGICKACNEVVPSAARGHTGASREHAPHRDVRAFAVEMLPENAQLLRELFGVFSVPGGVVHAAASGVSGEEAYVPKNFGVGRESAILAHNASLLTRARQQPLRVRTVTIDELAATVDALAAASRTTNVRTTHTSADRPLTASGSLAATINLLTIDAEGYDAAVLRGGEGVLSAGRVRVIEWEYHFVGIWAESGVTPVDTARWLLARRYVCYWQSRSGSLSPFLAACNYAFRAWSNVVCAHASEEAVLAALETLVPPELASARRIGA